MCHRRNGQLSDESEIDSVRSRTVDGEQLYRTQLIGDLPTQEDGTLVKVAGWVASIRIMGGVAFFDLRDSSGVAQVVVTKRYTRSIAEQLRREDCVTVEGPVQARPEGKDNTGHEAGRIEVVADNIGILSRSAVLPFTIDDRCSADENVRLRYRYLDLRRPRMAANLRARSLAIRTIRNTLDKCGFLDVETPTLVNSTPEGARDFLVPSRLKPGCFYALPQSPQLFKQLLMMSGVERYYQIARCYRDEDSRSDRQPEFTQLDIEGSFWSQEDVMRTVEQVVAAVVKELRGVDIPDTIPRITYKDALSRYGTDKPDRRLGTRIVDVTHIWDDSQFSTFRRIRDSCGTVHGTNAGRIDLPMSQMERLSDRAATRGADLIWAVIQHDGSVRTPAECIMTRPEMAQIVSTFNAVPGDLVLLVGGKTADVSSRFLLNVRSDLLEHADKQDRLEFVWVVDFPLFDCDSQGTLAPSHHPFTAPDNVREMRSRPKDATARAYDLVLNGTELGSGSVRIHDPDTQREIFDLLGISEDEVESTYGWFLEALGYGTPPHAGFALGVDRLVAILQDEDSIREVIPFPKTQSGTDLLTGAPTQARAEQLRDLANHLPEQH